MPFIWTFRFWRRRRDLNSRAGYPTYTLSRGASSPLEYISKAGGELLAIILYQALGRLSRLFLKKLTRFTKNSRHLSRILQKLILCWRFTYCKSSFLLLLPRALRRRRKKGAVRPKVADFHSSRRSRVQIQLKILPPADKNTAYSFECAVFFFFAKERPKGA